MIGASDAVAIVVGLVTLSGAALAIQWLYYWPKVQSVVKAAVEEAMKHEHEYVQREIVRIDSRHDGCIHDTKRRIDGMDSKMQEDIKYIRSRLDWIVNWIVENGKEGNHG